MRNLITICAAIILFGVGYARAEWTTLDYPGAERTEPYGISGNNIVGAYWDKSYHQHGFIYNGTSWTTLDMPEAVETYLYDIDSGNIVGRSNEKSFLYNGTSWATLDYPDTGYKAFCYGAGVGKIVGYTSWVGGGWMHSSLPIRSFIYDGTNWSTFWAPGAHDTWAYGINGSNVVGSCGGGNLGNNTHGFLFNSTTWTCTILDVPGAQDTCIRGIAGNNIVGCYNNAFSPTHGFLYNGTTWTTLDFPGSRETLIYGIDGSNIVGCCIDRDGYSHGFIYTIPEPCTILLFGLGGLFLRKYRMSN